MTEEQIQKLRETVANADSIAWDTCHKIYVAMDERTTDSFEEMGYDGMRGTPEEMLNTVLAWYRHSCGLRFVSSVSNVDEFATLVAQGGSDND